MEKLFQEALGVMCKAFRHIEECVPKPCRTPFKNSFVWRYKEESIEQALVQKLARVVSGLTAVNVLLAHGLLQEQGVLHRVLDELTEDIHFLVAAITDDEITKLHSKFLAAFFAEEFDDAGPIPGHKKPNSVQRKEIGAYLARVVHKKPNDFAILSAGAALSSAYAGFVHAASPHIMDLYGGMPPRFQVEGMLNTPRMYENTQDAWNYFYRGLVSAAMVAAAIKEDELFLILETRIKKFETDSEPLRRGWLGSS